MLHRNPLSETNRREDENLSALEWLCRSILRDASPEFQNAGIEACFYPYIGLTHTIRRKGAAWVIRISDHCRHAPKPVLEAIVRILACKILRRKPHRRFLQIYDFFRKDPQVLESVRKRRQLKGRKQISGNRGKYHSLQEVYGEINGLFFDNQIEIDRIGWGLRKSWNRLGHYDPVHHTITVSPVLDSPAVPKFVVSYIVYHEMLHAVFNDSPGRGLNKHHPPEFHRAERAYADFRKAKKFLKEFCSRRR